MPKTSKNPVAMSGLSFALLVMGMCQVGVASATTYTYKQPAVGLAPAPVVQAPASPPPAQPPAQLTLAGALPMGYPGQAYSFDLSTLISATGDPSFSTAQVTWNVTGLPSGLQLTGSTISGSPSASGTQTVSVTATYKASSATQSYSLAVSSSYASCLAYLNAHPGAPSGTYTLDVDGNGPVAAQSYYCDMTSDGGGWTKIVQQYESSPVTNWNGGVNGTAFALASSQIPSHTQVGFGKDNQATFVDYVTWTYSTGDIYPAVTVKSPKTGVSYQIYRSSTGWFYYHDPEQSWNTTWDAQADARNGLGLDAVGKIGFNWSFSPRYGSSYVANRGFGMAGSVYGTLNAYAWTVWVR